MQLIVKILSIVLLVSVISFSAIPAYAQMKPNRSPTRDLVESSRCNRYFPIYEHKYHMPSNLLRAISVTESGRYSPNYKRAVAWPWTINVEGKGYQYETKQEAIRAVKGFLAQGKESIDVGCMQINLKYHPDAFSNLQQAFEPRYNIAYAASFLAGKYEKLGSWETSIRHYHNVNTKYSDKYLERVYSAWRSEDRAVSVARLEQRNPSYITVRSRGKTNEDSSDISDITRSVLSRFVQ